MNIKRGLVSDVQYTLPKDWLEDFLEWLELENLVYNTIKLYKSRILGLMKKDLLVSEFHLQRAYRLRAKSKIDAVVLKRFMLFMSEKYRFVIPEFRFPKLSANRKVPKDHLSKEDVDKIFDGLKDEMKSVYHSIDLCFFFELMYYSAARVSEIVALKYKHLRIKEWVADGEKDYGRILLTNTKSKKDRYTFVPPFIMKRLKFMAETVDIPGDIRTGGELYVFDMNYRRKMRRNNSEDGRRLPMKIFTRKYINHTRDWFNRILNKASEAKLGRRVSSHEFRSARASHMERAGVRPTVIRDTLGHSDLSTTGNYLKNITTDIKAGLAMTDREEHT